MITNESVEQACTEVNAYTDERMIMEFDRFFREQPSVCDFVMELTSESASQIQELSLFLSYMVFKAVKMGHATTLTEVSAKSLESAYGESEQWIDRINQEIAPEDLPQDSEPFLLQYVISELNQPLEDGSMLLDEQKGEVFFLLRTVISSLTRSPLGKEIQ
jgi:hypothetical protein